MRMLGAASYALPALRSALGAPALYLRIGGENQNRSCARQRGRRELWPRTPHARRGERDRTGAHGLPQAIQSVRSAARALSPSSKRYTINPAARSA